MSRKKLNIMAQNSAELSAKHSQDNVITKVKNCKKEEGEKEIMTVEKQLSDKLKKMLVEAYKDMLSDSIRKGKKLAKKKRLENSEITEANYIENLPKIECKVNSEQLSSAKNTEFENKGVSNKMSKLKSEIDSLFDISYSQTHSKLVRLGKIQAKRERLTCYYAHGEISEDDYKKQIADLDILENEIKGTPPLKSNANAIILCRIASYEQNASYSLQVQEEALNKYCENKGMNLIGTHKIVEGVNGSRPAFNAILNYIEKQDRTIALVCDKVHRLLRKKEDYYRVEKLRKKGKLELHFVQDELVLSAESNSNDLLHYGLICGFTQQLAS